MNADESDPAAEFAIALSLREAGERQAKRKGIDLSDRYQGYDEFMRQCMRIGHEFEAWACEHVDFNELVDVWPYLLEDQFGERAFAMLGEGDTLHNLQERHWPQLADRLELKLQELRAALTAPPRVVYIENHPDQGICWITDAKSGERLQGPYGRSEYALEQIRAAGWQLIPSLK